MPGDLASLKSKLISDIAARDYTKVLLAEAEAKLSDLEDDLLTYEKIRGLFISTAKATQSRLEFHISNLVTTALQAVFEDDSEFQMQFIERRGKTEADLFFIKNGECVKPIDADGGGAVDVASLALRIAFWSLTKESLPLLIFDEPLRMLSKDLMPKAADMLKMISSRFSLQILMVTHSDELASIADKRYNVELRKGKTQVQPEPLRAVSRLRRRKGTHKGTG